MMKLVLGLIGVLCVAVAVVDGRVGVADRLQRVGLTDLAEVAGTQCDLYINFVMDVSSSMDRAEKDVMVKDTSAAVARLAAVPGRHIWYEFTRFATKASRQTKRPVAYTSEEFLKDLKETLAYEPKKGDGWTNHGAGLKIASENMEKSAGTAALTGVRRVVIVITDGETTFWTDTGIPEAESRNPNTEVKLYSDKIKNKQGAVLAVLFVGEPDALNMYRQKQAQGLQADREFYQVAIDKYTRLRREMLDRASVLEGKRLSADLGSFNGVASTIGELLDKSCGVDTTKPGDDDDDDDHVVKKGDDDDDDDSQECGKPLFITVIHDISRSVITSANAGPEMMAVWQKLAEIYSENTMIRIVGFAGKAFPILGQYTPLKEAPAKWASFKLGITNKYPLDLPPKVSETMVTEFEAATGTSGSHSAVRQVAFYGINGEWHWMTDDTLPGLAIRYAASSDTSGVTGTGKGKEVYILVTDGGPYQNSNPVCHSAYQVLDEETTKIQTANKGMSELAAHNQLMSSKPGLEKAASECCLSNPDCDLGSAVRAVGQTRPVVMLFAGTRFRSETSIRAVQDANKQNKFMDATTVVGSALSEYPKMVEEAASTLPYLNVPCHKKPSFKNTLYGAVKKQ